MVVSWHTKGAFGGANYTQTNNKTEELQHLLDQVMVKEDNIDRNVKVTLISQKTRKVIQMGKSLRAAYKELRYANWQNLPGTLLEVKQIHKIFPNSKIYTGNDVSESKIKTLSTQQIQKQYKVIHFATHGLVVPEIPKLSAIVLFYPKQSDEDGYLRMNEAANLDIEADFVNLSACETGLGKIVDGEGVRGLTQAFLIAGANALSVSLWNINDYSTMNFMVGMYQLVKEPNQLNKNSDDPNPYAKAMTLMKRQFIKHPKWQHPFYWAAFVYYGAI